eukprot:1192268-Ditylum_brightwellii.AAC.1
MAKHLARIHGTEEDKVGHIHFFDLRNPTLVNAPSTLTPPPPSFHLTSTNTTTKVNCPFYFKIGACRHADRCSRLHHRPAFSPTILIKHIYRHPVREAELRAAVMEEDGGDSSNNRGDYKVEVDKEKALEDFL